VSMLSEVDVLVLSEVYAAGEAPINGADGRALTRAIRARAKVDPVFVENIDELPNALLDVVEANDIVVTMGAGDIGRIASELASGWCQ